MPWGDGTGPWGLGPMTGRAAGYCAGYPVPGYMNPGPGFGRGFGRGRGFGWRFWFARPAYSYPPVPARTVPARYTPTANYEYAREDEIADLRAEKELLERDMKAIENGIKEINERLKELESKK